MGATDYVYGADRIAALGGTSYTWYAADALGSVRGTLDAAGDIHSLVSYDPWGQVERGTVPTFGFTGELQQGSQVYLRARWYHAARGGFGSVDPFAGDSASPVSLAPYLYAYNQPTGFTDPSGKYSCDGSEFIAGTTVLWSPDYAKFCKSQMQSLVSGALSGKYNTLRSSNMLNSLIFLFQDPTLPGGSRAAISGSSLDATFIQSSSSSMASTSVVMHVSRTSAQERLEFVLWITRSNAERVTNLYSGGGQFNKDFTAPVGGIDPDSGFAPEFQDYKKWNSSGQQVGHFLTAAQIGYVSDEMLLTCAVGHELVGDDPSFWSQIRQCAYGIGKLDAFYQAVDADIAGDVQQRDCIIRNLLGDITPDRIGNSDQDMRLTIKGYRFGQMIQSGQLQTNTEAAQWLQTELALHTP